MHVAIASPRGSFMPLIRAHLLSPLRVLLPYASPSLSLSCAPLSQNTTPKMEAVVGLVRRAKGQFEAALSKHFDGRRINLMGEINKIIG